MKKNILILLFLSFVNIVQAQTIAPQNDVLNINDVKIIPNYINNFSLSVDFTPSLTAGQTIDPDYWLTNKPNAAIVYQGITQDKHCALEIKPYVKKNAFGFIVSDFDETSLKHFIAKDNQITIQLKDDIKLQVADSNGQTQVYVLSKDAINKKINESLSITDSARAEYISALNNFYYYTNHLDFGISPDNSNSNNATAYYLTASFQNRYNSNFLKCDKPSDQNLAFFWSVNTRLSTNFKDSLNFINLYPVNLIWASKDYTRQGKLKVGNESDQTFTNKRVAVDGAFSMIIPVNPFVLTTEKDNRLRLKPIIDLGLKGYYDYSNDIEHFGSGQAYASGYYYIPVFNNYAIIFEGKAFYDFSTERNPDHKILGNYSISIGAEIPKTGFKALFKYTDGKTDINYKDGQVIVLGLLMDFFQEKQKAVQ